MECETGLTAPTRWRGQPWIQDQGSGLRASRPNLPKDVVAARELPPPIYRQLVPPTLPAVTGEPTLISLPLDALRAVSLGSGGLAFATPSVVIQSAPFPSEGRIFFQDVLGNLQGVAIVVGGAAPNVLFAADDQSAAVPRPHKMVEFIAEWLSARPPIIAEVLGVTRDAVYKLLRAKGSRFPRAGRYEVLRRIYEVARRWKSEVGFPMPVSYWYTPIGGVSLIDSMGLTYPNGLDGLVHRLIEAGKSTRRSEVLALEEAAHRAPLPPSIFQAKYRTGQNPKARRKRNSRHGK